MPPEKDLEALLSPEQLAAKLGLSRKSIYRRLQRGELPHCRLGRTIRFTPEQVERVIAQSTVEPAGHAA